MKAFSLPGFQNHSPCQEEDEDIDEEDNEEETAEGVSLHDSIDYIPEHDACFAHTLQLVIKDGFKEIGAVNSVLAKVAKIVAHVRRSQNATEILEGERRLQPKNATRWNSEVRSIKSILRVPEEKLKLIDTVRLTVHEKKCWKTLSKFYLPFKRQQILLKVKM